MIKPVIPMKNPRSMYFSSSASLLVKQWTTEGGRPSLCNDLCFCVGSQATSTY
jgi:hypothetical protein